MGGWLLFLGHCGVFGIYSVVVSLILKILQKMNSTESLGRNSKNDGTSGKREWQAVVHCFCPEPSS